MIICNRTTKARRADNITGRGVTPACNLLPILSLDGTIAYNSPTHIDINVVIVSWKYGSLSS